MTSSNVGMSQLGHLPFTPFFFVDGDHSFVEFGLYIYIYINPVCVLTLRFFGVNIEKHI